MTTRRTLLLGAVFVTLVLPMCAQDPDASLTETYWKLVQIGGQPAEVLEGKREAHIILHKGEGRAAGSAGCNRFSGSYDLAGDQLTFGPSAATRKMCADGMDQEMAYLQALTRIASYKIEGEELRVRDEDGEVLARFEAVYLP